MVKLVFALFIRILLDPKHHARSLHRAGFERDLAKIDLKTNFQRTMARRKDAGSSSEPNQQKLLWLNKYLIFKLFEICCLMRLSPNFVPPAEYVCMYTYSRKVLTV